MTVEGDPSISSLPHVSPLTTNGGKKAPFVVRGGRETQHFALWERRYYMLWIVVLNNRKHGLIFLLQNNHRHISRTRTQMGWMQLMICRSSTQHERQARVAGVAEGCRDQTEEISGAFCSLQVSRRVWLCDEMSWNSKIIWGSSGPTVQQLYFIWLE